MRSFARTSLGLLALALIAPIAARAQDASTYAPAGYQPQASALAREAVASPVVDASPAVAAEAPHKHRGRTLCAKCAAKLAASKPADVMPDGTMIACPHSKNSICKACQATMQAKGMVPGRIVGCAHSQNGVCNACQAALNMPGQFVMTGGPAPVPAPDAEAPGRALASSGMAPARPGAVGSAMADDGSAEPVPVGVVQANFAPNSPVGAASSFAPPASQPGRAVAESSSGHDPYQPKGSSFPHPHILGHLFGWSGLHSERAEERARRKSEAHAMISYDTQGGPSSPVEDLPASMVYGKKR